MAHRPIATPRLVFTREWRMDAERELVSYAGVLARRFDGGRQPTMAGDRTMTEDQSLSRQAWVRRIAADLGPGESVAGIFQASVSGLEGTGLLVVTSRRLVFYGGDAIAIPLERIRDVSYGYGHASGALALPNELVLRTQGGSYRLLIRDDEGGTQTPSAQRACELIAQCRVQVLLAERLL